MTGDTIVSIANLGLGHISQRSITAINDTNSTQAIACNRVWTPAVGECLRGNDWAFARSIVLLAESATYDPAPYGFTYAYIMPSNCQALRSVFYSGTLDKKLGEKYERIYDPVYNEELILTNIGGTDADSYAYARFTYNLTDVTKWDSAFVASFSYLLASKLAPVLIGQDSAEIGNMVKLYNNSISDTQRLDSYEDNNKADEPNNIVDSRG